jgi:hypothetical protein
MRQARSDCQHAFSAMISEVAVKSFVVRRMPKTSYIAFDNAE